MEKAALGFMEATTVELDEAATDYNTGAVAAMNNARLGELLSEIALTYHFDSWQFAALEEADRRLTQQE